MLLIGRGLEPLDVRTDPRTRLKLVVKAKNKIKLLLTGLGIKKPEKRLKSP
jgi:hypothetical protein